MTGVQTCALPISIRKQTFVVVRVRKNRKFDSFSKCATNQSKIVHTQNHLYSPSWILLLFFYLSFYSTYFSQESLRTSTELSDLSTIVIMPQIAIEFKASSFITFSCLEEQYLQCADAFKSEGIFQLMKESTQKKMVQEPNFWFLSSVNRRFI